MSATAQHAYEDESLELGNQIDDSDEPLTEKEELFIEATQIIAGTTLKLATRAHLIALAEHYESGAHVRILDRLLDRVAPADDDAPPF